MPRDFSAVTTIRWLIPELLGGSPLPSDDDLIQWKELGVEGILNLIAESYGAETLRKERELGFDVYHLPILDLEAPGTVPETEAALVWLSRQVREKRRTVVHCLGGIGRTSTILICFLIHHGESAEHAFSKVGRLGIGPQSYAQLSYIRQYPSFFASVRRDE